MQRADHNVKHDFFFQSSSCSSWNDTFSLTRHQLKRLPASCGTPGVKTQLSLDHGKVATSYDHLRNTFNENVFILLEKFDLIARTIFYEALLMTMKTLTVEIDVRYTPSPTIFDQQLVNILHLYLSICVVHQSRCHGCAFSSWKGKEKL